MLKDVIKKIDSVIPGLFPVNTAQFNDPVAIQTEWKSVRSGRSGGASAKLVQQDANLLAYKPSMAGRVMGVLFTLAGGFVFWLYFFMPGDRPWFFLLMGAVFALAGVLMLVQASSPVVFDKSAGLFYKGRKQQKMPDPTDEKHAASFGDIHAIQLITRLERSSNTDGHTHYYKVFEINLVKHDGQRLYVMTYGKALKARNDAKTIADFVQVPVWDGLDG